MNRGTVQADQAAALIIDPQDGAGFRNEGVLEVSGTGGLTINPGDFTNAGTVSVEAGRQLVRQGVYLQTAGVSLIEGTLSASAGTVLSGGILQGSGTIAGDVSNTGGVLAPGDSVGTLHLLDDYAQGSGGTIGVDLSSAGFDVLDVGGVATLGGTVAVSLLNGFAPMVGDTFQFLQAGSIALTFDGVSCTGCGRVFDVVYGADFAALRVAAVPLPAPAWLLAGALAMLAVLRRRR